MGKYDDLTGKLVKSFEVRFVDSVETIFVTFEDGDFVEISPGIGHNLRHYYNDPDNPPWFMPWFRDENGNIERCSKCKELMCRDGRSWICHNCKDEE